MIRVEPAPEPSTFDGDVRKPGHRALAEMVGESAGRRRGKKFSKIAAIRADIPPDKFPPYWRKALPDLLAGYRRVCAYLCLYIPRGTGAPSVDHMLPKSTSWDRVYEWTNYRLACSLMNSRKGAAADVLDPFEVQDGWFLLETVAYQLLPSPNMSPANSTAVLETIARLGLNDPECCEARGEFAEEYLAGHISLDYLSRHAPFVARELRRQGQLLRGDV